MNDDEPQPGSSDQPASLRRPDDLGDAFPPRLDAPISSNLRKEQVRAALFRKLEPIRVGRFILLEPLGAGAMGEIYAAYDDQLDRKVALKLMRRGSELKTDERLLREAQTLAQVSHPNVVQIYEAGTYNGRLFIAMELIRGKTLTSWLRDAARLPRAVRQREILRQFIAAGRGLEAAHAAGVAHRDFKPDNVLVGDDGRVRVVDFGLARALVDEPDAAPAGAAGELTDAARRRTREPSREELETGPTVMLDSADPPDRERGQAGIADSAAAPNHAGAIPLVTGGSTIDLEPAGPPAAPSAGAKPSSAKPTSPSRNARSTSPRLKAAVRLTETGTVMGTPCFMAPEQMRGAVADLRSDQFSFCVALYHALYDAFPFSGKSLRELRDSMESGKLEFASGIPVPTFVRRALHRGLSIEPSQRFPSMAELLAALEPRTRRRGWLAAAAAALVLATSTGLYLRAQATDPCATAGAAIDAEWPADRQIAMHAAFLRTSLPFAESAWHGVKTRVDGYTTRWHGEATAACRATHVAHTQSAEQLDKRMLCLDRGRRQLSALVSELGNGAPDAVEHAIEATAALPDLDTCSHAENFLFGVAPPSPSLAAQVAKLRDRLAQAVTLELLGRYDESQAIAREASAVTEHLGYPPVHAEALAQVASALDVRNTADVRAQVEKLYFEALGIAQAERHDQLVGTIWNKLVMVAVRMDSNMVHAREWWGQAYAWSRRNMSGRQSTGADAEQAELHYLLGDIYHRESEYAKSAEEQRRAIAILSRTTPAHLELSRYYDALARSLERLGDVEEARRLAERALNIATDTLGPGHPRVIGFEINYGKALERCGQLDRARSMLEDALQSMSSRDRDSHSAAALIHGLLSDLDYTEGRLDHAAEHGRASLQIYKQTLSPDHVMLAQAYTNLANVELKRRNYNDALVLYDNALSLRRRHLGNEHYQVAISEGSIAETLVDLERPDEAMPHLMEAERIFERGTSHERDTEEWMLTVRGELLVSQERFGAAVPVLERAVTLFRDGAPDPTNHALAMYALARALHELGRQPERVRELAERAHATFAPLGTVAAHDRDAVTRFLDRLPPTPPGNDKPSK